MSRPSVGLPRSMAVNIRCAILIGSGTTPFTVEALTNCSISDQLIPETACDTGVMLRS